MSEKPESAEIFVDGVKVGAINSGTLRHELPSGHLVMDISFKPNWPGIWHAQALSLDGDQE